ncbi:uncharacterized protein LOC116620173 isoform X1 [Nematostella vectensis]|uniref:uncharacterized protein LOC116620173 isoform X1 n=1 Tax=Nematostella vectensis TaxID=45351 RepID=UPI00207737C9|nr:uncharacterized protein LOC116620173 isoform X1 [Nematostella vectensis]
MTLYYGVQIQVVPRSSKSHASCHTSIFFCNLRRNKSNRASSRDRRRREAFAIICLNLALKEEEKPKRAKKTWIRPWMARREERDCYHQLVAELELEDEAAYFDYFRMDKRRFHFLVDAVDHKIRRNDTKYEVKHQTERKNGGNPEVSGHWGKLQVPPIPDPNQPDSNIGHNYLRGNAVRSHENSKLKRKLNGYCQHL